MKISVVIPAHNESRFIKRCLESLLSQTVKPDEIIVVNNNSTDDTVAIASQFPVVILHQKRKGIIPTRNKGFNAAKGDIIARLDADSCAPPDWIERIKYDFTRRKCDLVSGPLIYEKLMKTTLLSKAFLKSMKIILGYPPLLGPNMAISKTGWNKIRTKLCKSDRSVHEDFDIGLHAFQNDLTVLLDMKLSMLTSSRRILGDPQSYFIEYTYRLIKMHINHFHKDLFIHAHKLR